MSIQDNRLVAASLEADWNLKLQVLSEAEHQYDRQRQADQEQLSERQREQILSLATNFPQLWKDPATANRERKRMVRLLVEDITVKRNLQIQLQIRFRGDMSKTLVLPAPRKYYEARKQSPEMIAEMDLLLNDFNYRDIARILNDKGFKTGDGLPLTSPGVSYIRTAYGLKSRFDRLRERGLLTHSEIAEKYAISTDKVWRWRRSGLLRAHSYTDQDRCLYEDPALGTPQNFVCPTLRSVSSRGAV